jgi:CheY-like chemotaxis protein
MPTPKNNVVSQDKRGFNILLVEDEVDIAALYKESLQSDGHRVQVAHDGMSALAKLQASPDKIDIVVTDDQMPKLRGIDFARKLKALYPNTPVVLLSGFVSNYVENSLKAGDIDKYMLKPVSLGELRTSIFHLLFSE